MFIFKLSKSDSDNRSAIIRNVCVRSVRAGDQTQEIDECLPSLKYNQVLKDTRQKITVYVDPVKFLKF